MKLIVISQYSKNETLLQFFLQILTNYMFSWTILLPAKVQQTSAFPTPSTLWGGRVPLETRVLCWSQWWERIWELTYLLPKSWSWLCFFLSWTRWVVGDVRLPPVFWFKSLGQALRGAEVCYLSVLQHGVTNPAKYLLWCLVLCSAPGDNKIVKCCKFCQFRKPAEVTVFNISVIFEQ